MAEEFSREYVGQVLRLVDDRLKQALGDIEVVFGDAPFGMKRATSEDVMRIFGQWTQLSPPEEMVLPDGTPVFESPWVLALRTGVSGGSEFLSRYRAAVKRLPVEEF